MSAKLTLINGDGASSRRNGMDRLASALDTTHDEVSEKIKNCCTGNVIGISNVFKAMTCQEKARELQEQLGHYGFEWGEEPEYSFKALTDPEEIKKDWPDIGVSFGQIFTSPEMDLCEWAPPDTTTSKPSFDLH